MIQKIDFTFLSIFLGFCAGLFGMLIASVFIPFSQILNTNLVFWVPAVLASIIAFLVLNTKLFDKKR